VTNSTVLVHNLAVSKTDSHTGFCPSKESLVFTYVWISLTFIRLFHATIHKQSWNNVILEPITKLDRSFNKKIHFCWLNEPAYHEWREKVQRASLLFLLTSCLEKNKTG
jgi:hypothetical protein